jgi:hypothetical protein
VLAQPDARDAMGDSMLACFDLAQLQTRYGREIDPSFERGSFQRIHIELTAQVG